MPKIKVKQFKQESAHSKRTHTHTRTLRNVLSDIIVAIVDINSAVCVVLMAESILCLMTAYDTETAANITMTYVPAHLYYMLFELMKVSVVTACMFCFICLQLVCILQDNQHISQQTEYLCYKNNPLGNIHKMVVCVYVVAVFTRVCSLRRCDAFIIHLYTFTCESDSERIWKSYEQECSCIFLTDSGQLSICCPALCGHN